PPTPRLRRGRPLRLRRPSAARPAPARRPAGGPSGPGARGRRRLEAGAQRVEERFPALDPGQQLERRRELGVVAEALLELRLLVPGLERDLPLQVVAQERLGPLDVRALDL